MGMEERTAAWADIDPTPFREARLERGLTVAALVSFEGPPRGRAALVSQWATTGGGRAFELGMEWDGYPYFMVSGTGQARGMGIVYAEQPLERATTVLLSGSFEPGRRMAIYANGIELGENEAVVPASVHRPDRGIRVGGRPGCGTSCAFDGAVGDVLIWDHPLAPEEHRALAQAFGLESSAARAWRAPERVVYDLDRLADELRSWYAGLESGEWPGAYKWEAHDAGPELYASADIAWIRWIISDLDDLPSSDRQLWISYLRSFQSPEDGTYPPQRLHDQGHAIAHVTAALNALGGAHRYHPSFQDPLLAPGAVEPWLESLDWYWQWGGSCTLWGHGMTLLSTPSTPPAWGEALFAWLDREVDPEIGAWRRGRPVRHQVDYVGGGFHIWTLYATAGRPLPHPERVIDLALALQRPDGDFDRKFGCGVLDGVWALAAAGEQTSYRHDDVEEALRRSLHGLMDLAERGRFEATSHGTLSRVGTLAILQHALPGELRSSRPWRDPWAEPRLFEIRAEEPARCSGPR